MLLRHCARNGDRSGARVLAPDTVDNGSPGETGEEMKKSRLGVAVRACLGALLVLGLGYLYVGRARLAAAAVLACLALLALLSWTRLILHAWSLYALAGVWLAVLLASVAHATRIAWKGGVRARRYKVWWAYLLWTAAVWSLPAATTRVRPSVLGFEAFQIHGAGMSPSLQPGDFVVADTWRYRRRDPAVGEVVIYEDRPGGRRYVSRVVGLPGDRLEIRNGLLFRNGQPVSEPYLHGATARDPYGLHVLPLTLGPAQVYLLDDFRDRSVDSRVKGPVGLNRLHARVAYVWLSVSGDGVRWERFPRNFATR